MVNFAPWTDTHLHYCKLEKLDIIDLNPVNILMITVKTTKKHHHCNEITQTRRGSKSVCAIWIRLTDSLLIHTRTSFMINVF